MKTWKNKLSAIAIVLCKRELDLLRWFAPFAYIRIGKFVANHQDEGR